MPRYATFAFKVNDGEADSPRSRTMTIKVLAVNDPPTSAEQPVERQRGRGVPVQPGGFQLPGSGRNSRCIPCGVLALPERGALWLRGVRLTQGRRVLSADIGRGEFRFSPAANANGAGYASFTFKVSDGLDDSAETYTMTFDVAARNDPPQGLPMIVGQAVVNSTVTADTSGITDVDGLVGVAFEYQWIRVGTDDQGTLTETEIGTAAMASYAVTEDDMGSFLKVKVTFTDDGGTTASLSSTEVPVAAGNQAPEGGDGGVYIDEDGSHVFAINDFGFYDFDFNDVLSSVRVVTLPDKGLLKLYTGNSADPPQAVVAGQSVSAADIQAGKLRFEPAPDESAYEPYTSFTFKVSDGRAEAERANRMEITVQPVSDPATGDPVITGTARVGGTLRVDTSAIEDVEGLTNVLFEYQWIRVDGGNETDIPGADGISYQPVALDAGKSLKVKVSFFDDEGGSESRSSAAVPVAAGNQAPEGADGSIEIDEDNSHVFVMGGFGFRDSDDGDALSSVRIETLPDKGRLTLDGENSNDPPQAVVAGQSVSASDIQAGKLKFEPAANESAIGSYTSFTFKVSDGRAEAERANRMGITVRPVPDPATGDPVITGTARVGGTLRVDTSAIEDPDGLQNVRFNYQWIRVDGANEADIFGANETAYQPVDLDVGKKLKVGVSFNDDQFSQEERFSAPTDVVLEMPNNPPTAANGTISLTEDTPRTFNVADFNFSDADTGDTLASVVIVSLPAVGSLALAPAGAGAAVAVTENQSLAAADIGRLTFTPAANGNGTGYASFTFKVNDGEDDSASSFTMTVNVAAVDDPPTGAPTIVGTLRVGETLSVDTSAIEDVDGLTAPDFRYQWITVRDNGQGAPVQANIAGATGAQYRLVPGNLGARLKVRVRFVDDAGGAGNLTSGETGEVQQSLDTTAPRVASIARQSPTASPTNADSLTWRVTFSEAVANLDEADFALGGTTATLTSAVVPGSSAAYDVTAAGGNLAGLDGAVTLSFDAGQNIQDAAGNALTNTTPTGPTEASYLVDNTRPGVTISGVPNTSSAPFTATITFLEGVSGFAVEDIAVGNGTASTFTGSDGATAYTALIRPAEDGAVTVDVAQDVARDAAGNGNLAAARVSSTYAAPDTSAPRVDSIEFHTPTQLQTNADSLTWRVTFSEAVANVDGEDFAVSGTSATLTAAAVPGSSTAYDVTAAGGDLAGRDGAVTLSFAAGQNITDAASNALANTTPTGAGDSTYLVDNLAPTVTITDVPDTSSAPFTATISFSERVSGFVVTDIAVGNGAASTFTGSDGATVYTALIRPTVGGTVTVDVAEDVARDAAGNGNLAAARVSSTYTALQIDTTAPRVVSIEFQNPTASPTNAESLTWRVTFSEAVANLDGADFAVGGTSATLTAAAVPGSSPAYDVTATGGNLASFDGTVTLSFAVNQNIQDAAGNALANTTPTGANEASYVLDNTAPTAPSYSAPGSLKVGEAISAMNPSGGVGIDRYSATGLPSGLSIDTNSGAISGMPDAADASTTSATVTVSDAAGNTAAASITFPAVAKGDQALSGFQYSASSVPFGSAAPSVTAPSGARTSLSYSATPAEVCTVGPSTGALTLLNAGICEITATAAATANYNSATASYTVTVQLTAVLTLNLDAIAGDNRINIAEKAAGFTIGGDTGSVGGVSFTVTVGATELTATSADADPAAWSVSVPADASYITGTSLIVEVNASKTGYSAPVAVRRSLTVDLTAPTAPSYSAPASLKVGVSISAMNPSGGVGIDRYSATGLPSGLSLNDRSGVISGTPDTADANTASATVTVTDDAGNTATASVTFPAVAKGDQALSGFQYSASSVAFGAAVPSVTAPTGVLTTLSYSATLASVCTVDPSSGALTLVGAGACEITATAAATANYNSATATFTITVQTLGALLLNLDAIADDNRINIAEKAAGFTIGGDTGSVGGVSVTVTVGATELTATSAEAGSATWSVSVPADASFITGTSLIVEVNALKTGYSAPSAVRRSLTVDLTAPTAPSYSAPATLKVGEAITAISPSGGSGIDEYGATGLPSGLRIDDSSGVIGGTPVTADASTTSATVTVGDAAGNTATASITFPAVEKGDQALNGFQYSASSVTFVSATIPSVTAPTGVLTTLSYSATPAEVCTVGPSTGALTLVGAGDCEITATAAATANYNSAIATFTVTVQPAGVLVLNLNAIATDNTINIAEKAAGFDIGGDTGTESGVAVTVQVGTETLTATSADDAGTATWSVSVPADASYITGTSVEVSVNASKSEFTALAASTRSLTVDLTAPTAPAYSAPASLQVGVTISAMNPSGGSGINEYGATGLPSGLSLNDRSGVISGTPDTADANTASATVTVTDAAGNLATASVTFPAVDKGDQALTGFQYSPSSVTYGSGTVPSVTAPTGVLTSLSYTATPAGVCGVDSSTGALTLLGAGVCEIAATAAGSDDYNEAIATYPVTVQAAGALALTLDAIAGDGTVNIAEKAAGFEIGGDTGTEAGVGVTVGIGGETLTTTSADDAGTATWAVSVPPDAAYISGASVAVEVNALKTGYTAPAAITRSLAVDLTAPTAPRYSAPTSLKVGEAITSMNPSGGVDIDEYSAAGLRSGLGIDAGGVISGTPDKAEANTATATITVSDAAGNSAPATIIFPAVDKGDQALTGFQYSPSSVTYGSGTVPAVTAPTGVLTTLSYLATPADVCTVDPTSGALTLVGAGDCVIAATAAGSDDYNEAIATYPVTVQAAGALALTLDAIATDDIINIAEKGTGFTISGDTGSEGGVSVTVTLGDTELTATSADDAGTATWTVSVPPGASYISGASVAVEVNASKTGYTAPAAITRSLAVDLRAPTAPGYSAPGSLKVGEAITSMSPSGGVDIDEYRATGLPPGLGIDDTSGVIGGTPEAAEAATVTATVTVSDAAGNTATAPIIFPAVDKGDQALTGFQYSPSSVTYGSGTVPSVTAPTGVLTSLSYTATPAGVCGVDSSTGALTLLGAGVCEIAATAAGSGRLQRGNRHLPGHRAGRRRAGADPRRDCR